MPTESGDILYRVPARLPRETKADYEGRRQEFGLPAARKPDGLPKKKKPNKHKKF